MYEGLLAVASSEPITLEVVVPSVVTYSEELRSTKDNHRSMNKFLPFKVRLGKLPSLSVNFYIASLERRCQIGAMIAEMSKRLIEELIKKARSDQYRIQRGVHKE